MYLISCILSPTERQRCALWIKKLCDPATCGSGLIGCKNRNMYARLLLHMLKRGVLEGPFTNKPEPGSLKTLPTYMVRMTASLNHKYRCVASQLSGFKAVNYNTVATH